MILHITIANNTCSRKIFFKFSKNIAIGLHHYISKDIKPASMSHPKHKLFPAKVGKTFNNRLEKRNKGVSPLKRKSFLANELMMQEFLEEICAHYLLQYVFFISRRELDFTGLFFDPRNKPISFTTIMQMSNFNANATAVNILKNLYKPTNRTIGIGCKTGNGKISPQMFFNKILKGFI